MDLVALSNSPLPVVLALGGIILVLFAIIGRVGGNIRITLSKPRQWLLFGIGLLLITVGVIIYAYPGRLTQEDQLVTPTTTTLPPNVGPDSGAAPAATTGIVITPPNDSTVQKYETATGSIAALPPGVRAFICVRAASTEGPVLPQGEVSPSETGAWSTEVTFESPGARYEIFIVTSSQEEATRLLSDPNSGIAGLPKVPDGAAIVSPINTLTRE